MTIYKKLDSKIFAIKSSYVDQIKGLKKAVEGNLNTSFCRKGLIGKKHAKSHNELVFSEQGIDYTIITTSKNVPVRFDTLKRTFDFTKNILILSFDLEIKMDENEITTWIYNVCKNIAAVTNKGGFVKMFKALRSKEYELISCFGNISYKLQLLTSNPNFEKVLKVYETAGFKITNFDFDFNSFPPRKFLVMKCDN
jgi:hypothetical protein